MMAYSGFSSSQFTGLIWLAVGLVLTYVPISCYLNYRRCAHIKGPWLATVSNLWLFKSTLSGRGFLDQFEVLEKYGPIARIAPGKVITNDPELWRLTSTPRSTFTRGTWYDSMTLHPDQKNSMSQRDDKEHNKLRAKLIRGYSGKDIPDLESYVDQSVNDLINLLRRQAVANKPVDIARLAQFFTLDILTHIAFGRPFGYLTENRDVYEYIEKVSSFLSVLELGSNFPLINKILTSKLMAPFAPKTTDTSGMGAMLGVAHRVVRERYDPASKPKSDMLGSFIKSGLTQSEAESESMLQILGGSDSTATAIRTTFLYILTNPRVYSRLTSELDTALPYAHSPPVLTCAQSRTLPYLQSCIKEGLRIFPPLTGLQTKLSPSTGFTYNNTFIPPGTELCWNPMSMQRRPEIYGPDASLFRPERWLEPTNPSTTNHEDSAAKLARMTSTLDLVFGSGRYGCLGKTVAFIELDKVFAALFGQFEFELVDPFTPMRSVCYGVYIQTDLWVRVKERRREKV